MRLSIRDLVVVVTVVLLRGGVRGAEHPGGGFHHLNHLHHHDYKFEQGAEHPGGGFHHLHHHQHQCVQGAEHPDIDHHGRPFNQSSKPDLSQRQE